MAFDEYHSVIRGHLFGEPVSADNRVFLTREKYNLWQFVNNLLQSASSEIVISTAFLTFQGPRPDVGKAMKDKVWGIVKQKMEEGVRLELYTNNCHQTLSELLLLCNFLERQPMEFVRAAPQAHAKCTLVDRKLGILHTGNYTSSGLGIENPSFEAGLFLSCKEIRRILAYRFHYQYSTDESLPYFLWLHPQVPSVIPVQDYVRLMSRYLDELSTNLSGYFSAMSADVVEFADFDLPGESREYFLYLEYLIDQLHRKLRSLRLMSTAQQMSELLGYLEREILEYGTDEPEHEEISFQSYCEEVQAAFEKAARELKEEISATYPNHRPHAAKRSLT
jgi:hypothetical protein